MEEQIRALLLKKGHEIFAKKGFKKTNVAEIAEAADIAVGSFYKFFNSKEHLFLEIFADENLRAEREILESEKEGNDITDYVKRLTLRLIAKLKSDPILKIWHDRELWHKIIGKCSGNEIGRSQSEASSAMFSTIIERWQKEKRIRTDLDARYILAMFDSLFIIDIYAEDIGSTHFPALIETMIEFIMQGLQTGCVRNLPQKRKQI